MADMLTFDWRDVKGFEKTLKAIGGVPQKAATKAAGKGMTVVRKSVRGQVPVRTGELKRGIIRHGERSKLKGKKVYDLYFDPAKNDIFQRPIKEPGVAGGNTKNGYAYYPASMEYGFLTRSSGGGLSYVPGYHFMRRGAEDAAPEAANVIRETVVQETERIWREKNNQGG